MSCSNVGGVGAEEGNGVARGGRRSFKSCDTSGKILDEVVIGKVAFGSGGFGKASGAKRGREGGREEKGRGGEEGARGGGPSSQGEKCGENVMAIVNGGSEGRVLDFRGEEGGWSGGFRWKETNELESFGVGAVASNTVVFGDGLVERG